MCASPSSWNLEDLEMCCSPPRSSTPSSGVSTANPSRKSIHKAHCKYIHLIYLCHDLETVHILDSLGDDMFNLSLVSSSSIESDGRYVPLLTFIELFCLPSGMWSTTMSNSEL